MLHNRKHTFGHQHTLISLFFETYIAVTSGDIILSPLLLLLICLCLPHALLHPSHSSPHLLLGPLWNEYTTGECELWWATDRNNWYFFIRTHVHPPTHKVTHAFTVTLLRVRFTWGTLEEGGAGCTVFWRRDCVCWHPVKETDFHRQRHGPCVHFYSQ